MKQGSLAGRRILIAGGTGDVGVEVVSSLLSAGAEVLALARSRSRAAGLPDHARLHLIEGFPDSDESISSLSLEIGALGGIDGAIASLGPWFHGPKLTDLPRGDWDRMVAASLTSHFMFARLAVPHLRQGEQYLMINGGAALAPIPHSGVVSILARAQTMLAEVLAAENPNLRIHTLILMSIIATRARPDPDPAWVTAKEVGDECVRLFTADALAQPETVTRLAQRPLTKE